MGIAMGGGSENGVLLNGHSNPGEMWSTGYNDNIVGGDENISTWNSAFYQYSYNNVTAFYYGETINQVAFMTATFGNKYGVFIDDGADVVIMGHGTDFSQNGIRITGNANALIIDPQCIGTYYTEPFTSTAIAADSDFSGSIKIYNLCAWNINDTAVRSDNGYVMINGATLVDRYMSSLQATDGAVDMSGIIVYTDSSSDVINLSN